MQRTADKVLRKRWPHPRLHRPFHRPNRAGILSEVRSLMLPASPDQATRTMASPISRRRCRSSKARGWEANLPTVWWCSSALQNPANQGGATTNLGPATSRPVRWSRIVCAFLAGGWALHSRLLLPSELYISKARLALGTGFALAKSQNRDEGVSQEESYKVFGRKGQGGRGVWALPRGGRWSGGLMRCGGEKPVQDFKGSKGCGM